MKRLRSNERKRERNMRVKSAMRTAIRNAEEAISADDSNAEELFRLAVKEIDKAASKGVIKRGKAGRKKSRLAKKLNKIRTEAEE